MQRTIDSDQKHLTELQAELANLEKEYQQADAEFKQLDARLEKLRKREVAQVGERNRLRLAPPPATELAKKWDLAKQRFELAIRERKALQTSIATLETKMTGDRQALDKLLKPADPVVDSPDPPSAANAVDDALDAPATLPPAADPPASSSGVDPQVVTALLGLP